MMRPLLAFLILAAPALTPADDRIPLDLIAIVERTRKPAPKPEPKPAPPKAVEKSAPPRVVRQVFRQRVTRGPRPQLWNWEGDWSPTHTFAVSHLRAVHGRRLPQHIDISDLGMEDLNRIHSHIHNGKRSLGYWEAKEVNPDSGVQIVVWVWTL